MNRVLAIIIPDSNDRYDYVKSTGDCESVLYDKKVVPYMLCKNRFNVKLPSEYKYKNKCGVFVYNTNYRSYCSIYTWNYFSENIKD